MSTSKELSEAPILPTEPIRNAKIVAVRESLVNIETQGNPIRKNEVGYICLQQERIKAEVLRVRGTHADMQVFEDTTGMRVGDQVELSGEMLSAVLGPGLLGQVFDGLENPLQVIADKHGFFLPRGVNVFPLNRDKTWNFTPSVSVGDKLTAGQTIGSVQEGNFAHKIMIPFHRSGSVEIVAIQEGSFTSETPIARIRLSDGKEKEITLYQRGLSVGPCPNLCFARS